MTAIASYMPGDWVAVSAPGTWLLVALPPDHPIVQRCWELMSGDSVTEDILDALVSEGIRFAPHFALACAVGRRRVLARGTAAITVTDSAGAIELKVSAEPGAVWAEEGFTEAVDMLLLTSDTAPVSEFELPMASGVTMASSIRIRSNNGELAPSPVVSATSITWPLPPTAARATATAAAVLPTSGSGEPGGPEGLGASATVTDVEQVGEPGESNEAGMSESARSYDFLFGATQRPPAHPDEVVAPPDRLPASSDPGLTAGWSTTVPPALAAGDGPPADAPADPPDDPAAHRGRIRVIDAVPWLTPELAGRADRAGPAQPAGRQNDRTPEPDSGADGRPIGTADRGRTDTGRDDGARRLLSGRPSVTAVRGDLPGLPGADAARSARLRNGAAGLGGDPASRRRLGDA